MLTFKDDLLEWKPDLVHCNDWQTISLGAFVKSRISCKLIFDSHELETHRNPPLPKNRKRWMERYEQIYLNQCDVVTTVSESISEYLEKQYSIDRPLIIYNSPIYPNTYPTHAYFNPLSEGSNVRKDAKISSDIFLLVTVGNVTVNRGIEKIIVALSDLPKEVHLAVVGRVMSEFRIGLDGLVAQYGLGQRVHFFDPVNPTDVVDFISTADAGIISLIPATLSYDYALPNKFFECAFARLPIIASDTKEIKKKVIDYELGEIYKYDNVKELRNSVMNFYKRKKLPTIRKCNYEKFIKDHDFESGVKILLNRLI